MVRFQESSNQLACTSTYRPPLPSSPVGWRLPPSHRGDGEAPEDVDDGDDDGRVPERPVHQVPVQADLGVLVGLHDGGQQLSRGRGEERKEDRRGGEGTGEDGRAEDGRGEDGRAVERRGEESSGQEWMELDFREVQYGVGSKSRHGVHATS